MAQARHGERAAAEPENLSNEQITSTQPRPRLSLEHASEGKGASSDPSHRGAMADVPDRNRKIKLL